MISVRMKHGDHDMSKPKPMRVWIELDRPVDKADGDKRAQLATNILRRCGDPYSKFWWNERRGLYCITIDSGGSYKECIDNGHWFNLEYLGGSPTG